MYVFLKDYVSYTNYIQKYIHAYERKQKHVRTKYNEIY